MHVKRNTNTEVLPGPTYPFSLSFPIENVAGDMCGSGG
jgi:hypothetical protein